MSSDQYLQLLSRHLEAESAHLLRGTLATLSDDCMLDDMALGRRFETRDGAGSCYRMWREAFSVAVRPEELHLSGDVTVAETIWLGCHVGPFGANGAQHRGARHPLVAELRDGLLAGERLYWDRGTLAGQPGAPLAELTCTLS